MADNSNTRDDRLMAMLVALVHGQNQLRGELQGLTQVLKGHEDHHPSGENDREVYGGERNNHNEESHNNTPPLDNQNVNSQFLERMERME